MSKENHLDIDLVEQNGLLCDMVLDFSFRSFSLSDENVNSLSRKEDWTVLSPLENEGWCVDGMRESRS